MKQRTFVSGGQVAALLLVVMALAGCGGGGGGDAEDKAFSIRGNVSGLNGSVVLQNNGGDDITVSIDGPFAFPTEVTRGAPYAVTVRTQPSGQICTVANGSGMTDVPITDVLVSCANDPSFTVGGVVTGLVGTVVLRNGAETRAVSTNGTFTFVGRVTNGGSYNVTVATQPLGQTCTVINGSGTIQGANVTNVTVRCVTDIVTYSIGGTVSGLNGTVQLRLTHPGSTDTTISISSNGDYDFDPEKVEAGDSYSVTIAAQPAGQRCAVDNSSGTANGNVTNVDVTCSTVVPDSHSIGGNVSGLSGGTLGLTLVHPGDPSTTISIGGNGHYDFDPELVQDGNTYTVSITTQPSGQVCTIVNATGIATGDVNNVDVNCTTVLPTGFRVGGTISGLSGVGLEIENGALNSVRPAAGSTSFTLPVEFSDNAVFDVGIAEQPAGQTCVLTDSHGQIDHEDVDRVSVTCIDNVTDPIVGTYTIPSFQPNTLAYFTLFADGVYIYGSLEDGNDCHGDNDGGVEYGVYDYDQSTGSFTIKSAVVDTNGRCGVWDNGSQFDGTLSIAGSGQGKVMTLTPSRGGQFDLVPVESRSAELFGSFADIYHKNFWVFIPAGDDLYFFNTQTQNDSGSTSVGFDAGVEFSCGDISGTSVIGTLDPEFDRDQCEPPTPDDDPVDTNGTSGLSDIDGQWSFSVIGDSLSSSSFGGRRVVPN